MNKRGRFGALAGALLLTFAVASVAFAAAPTYGVAVTKAASPTAVPAAGGSITFTVWVTNTGTADFHGLTVEDTNASCVYDGPVASASDKFESGAAWQYTCTYTVVPPQTNTVTVFACHDSGNCNSGNADATASASVTITVAVVVPAPTPTPTPVKVKVVAPITSTTALVSGSAGDAWLLMIALGVLLASVVILTPRGKKSES